MTTNYNEGKWHGWNGGECPVHPETLVSIVTTGGSGGGDAGWFIWDGLDCLGHPIIAFRVIKEHKEPREFWIRYDENKQVSVIGSPIDHYNAKPGEIIHVREVTQ